MLADLFSGYTDAEIDAGTDRLLAAIDKLPPAPKATAKPITMDQYEADGFPRPESDCEL